MPTTVLAKLQDDLGVTTLYVTHDQTEAMTMGDRVAVLLDGVLQQVDTPAALYDDPVNLFVAGFIGSPSMNLVEADVEDRDGSLWVTFGSHGLRLPDELLERRPATRSYVDRQVVLGVRPEHLQDVEFPTDHPEEEQLEADVTFREAMGSAEPAPTASQNSPRKASIRDSSILRPAASRSESCSPVMGEPA